MSNTIAESYRPPNWSLDASETGESTKCLSVGQMGLKAVHSTTPTHGYSVLSPVSLASRNHARWRPVGLNDRHLRSQEKIEGCGQSRLNGTGYEASQMPC